MKITNMETSATFNATLPNAPFANSKPGFTARISFDLIEGEDPDEALRKAGAIAKRYVDEQFEMERNRLKAAEIKMAYPRMRLYQIGKFEYPSVTTIIGWDKEWYKISEVQLAQYGARGHIIHRLVEIYKRTDKWVDLDYLATKEDMSADVVLMTTGSEGLTVENCSHIKFFEKYGEDFKLRKSEQQVHSTQHEYAGTYDWDGTYKDIESIIDIKSGSDHNFMQLAAYAMSDQMKDKKIEQLVICPVGKTANKTGCMSPSVCTDIDGEFKKFLAKRADFRQHFSF